MKIRDTKNPQVVGRLMDALSEVGGACATAGEWKRMETWRRLNSMVTELQQLVFNEAGVTHLELES
jgi:hypothetical protein